MHENSVVSVGRIKANPFLELVSTANYGNGIGTPITDGISASIVPSLRSLFLPPHSTIVTRPSWQFCDLSMFDEASTTATGVSDNKTANEKNGNTTAVANNTPNLTENMGM